MKNPLVLAAAYLAGVDRVFAIGGAQAIGALAYGTATIPAVDKICGPGNAYVAAAKRRVFGTVGIDMIAGPSEILVIADASANPRLGRDGPVRAGRARRAARNPSCCRPTPRSSTRVAASIARLLPAMPRRDIIRASLEGRGALIRVADMDEACAIANHIAPEHLEIAAPIPHHCWRKSAPCRRDFPRPLHEREPGRLLRRPEPRAADVAHRALFLAAGRLRLPEAQQRDRSQRGRRADARADRR